MPISLLWILAFYFAGTLDAVGVPEMLEASEKVCPRGRNEQAHPVSHRGRGPGIRGKICRDNAGKGLGPFPDFTGKGRFAFANSYRRPLRIWLAVGHEHARRLLSILRRAVGWDLRLRRSHRPQCLLSVGADRRRHAQLVATAARGRLAIG